MEARQEVSVEIFIEPIHRFSDGLYLREIFMPKGTLVVGRKHKFPHFFSLLSGRCVINGVVYSAPYLTHCDVGSQRCLYAMDDVSLMTIHSNPLNLRDPVQLFDHYSEAP